MTRVSRSQEKKVFQGIRRSDLLFQKLLAGQLGRVLRTDLWALLGLEVSVTIAVLEWWWGRKPESSGFRREKERNC